MYYYYYYYYFIVITILIIMVTTINDVVINWNENDHNNLSECSSLNVIVLNMCGSDTNNTK